MNSKLKAQNLTRREFLKLSAIGAGSLILRPHKGVQYQGEFPVAERLGRVNAGVVELRAQPNIDSPSLGVLYEDAVVPWLREVVGTNPYRFNQRWVETPDGYMWAPFVQPVRNQINQPVTSLPESSLGPGMWVETTVPWVEMALENPPARTQSFKALAERGLAPRLYYSQIFWVDQMRTDEQGQVWYRVNERFGNGELLWGRAEAFRPMTTEEMTPISPEVEDKLVEVNLARQTLSCFENGREVFFCRVSTGLGGAETPVSDWHRIWRKMVSSHLAGGTNAYGWDLPGIGWTTLFVGTGIAIHSTYWHNNYGEVMSRGCVNARPEDSKFVFRWTQPAVTHDPGDVTVSGQSGSRIRVFEV
jgi:hypothetical protein